MPTETFSMERLLPDFFHRRQTSCTYISIIIYIFFIKESFIIPMDKHRQKKKDSNVNQYLNQLVLQLKDYV